MTNTINAATIYAAAIAAADTIKAAATAAGWGHYADEQTPGAIYRGMIDDAKRLASGTPYGYEMEHAQALEIEPDHKAPHWMRAHSYTHEDTHKATIESMRAAALSELLEHITAPSAPEFLTIKTSERGAMRIKNCAKNLQNFAAKVKSNAKAFGGGFTRATSANKGAQNYSAQALKVWRERLQERDYAGALELADDKLSPLFFIGNKGVPFMMVAPVDVDGWPDLFSAMHENGKYNVQEKHAGRAISADYKAGTRAKSLELATAAWREASEEKRANALHRARTDAVSQAKARAAWCELRGLETTTSEETAQDQAAAMAQDQAHACEQVAAIVATAAAAAAIATAQETSAAHQAETSEARELETCSAATSEATRRERAQALRILIQKNADNVAGFDDTPEDNDQATTDQADQPSAAQGIDTPASAAQAGQSIEGADYTTPRETSAPAADYITPRKTLKIAEIHRVIDSCNWSRNDLGGATRSEFKAMNVPARLNPHIDAVRALQIPARFKRDIENQANAIEYAKKTIERWHAMQDQPQPPSAPDNAPPEPTTGNTMTNTNTEPERMTGAELQTLRESCNLSREDFAGLAGVQSRTVKHWESGCAGVPADVAHLVNTIDGAINAAADQARAHLEQLTRQNDQAPADIVLIRYRSNEDLHQYRPDMQSLPACVHGAIVNRMRQEARAIGMPARIVWMEPEQYNPWRAACHLPDTESTRAAWAAQQVDAQAMPHRGDQPPA